MKDLELIFHNTAEKYTDNKTLIRRLWQEIQESYSGKSRHYHNLSHIEKILKGRVKVLNHFLGMERIYKSEYFFYNLEKQAKENIAMEIKQLSQ